MTLIVATAIGDTPDELYAAARSAAEQADWVEIRLDGPSGLPWDLRAFFVIGKPCIATMRHADEGGRSHADDATRADALRRALKSGARAIDVEMTSDARDALVKEAHDAGARVILSRHDLAATPTAPQMLGELQAMRRAGADWCKLATRVDGPGDAAALVETALAAREAGLPYALMAVNDPFLRLMAPTLGMALAYASVEGQAAGAPGQVPARVVHAIHARQTAGARGGTTATRAAYLLGQPVAHSASPAMQNAAFAAAGIDATYLAIDVAHHDLEFVIDGLKRTGALGANVTVPHKTLALLGCDDLDDTAREAGAVNTLRFDQGRAIGHNTDGDGAVDTLRENGVPLEGAEVLLLGAGGAARGIAFALARAGAKLTITNRTLEKAQALAEAVGARWLPWDEREKALPHVGIVVNATTIGMHDDASPVGVGLVASHVVLDAVYRAGGTPLARAARLGIRGDEMLLHQGARAFRIWTGKDAPLATMRAALKGALSR